MTDLKEQIAIALWHRFAPEWHVDWSEEEYQAEYRDAADAVLLLAQPSAAPVDSKPAQSSAGNVEVPTDALINLVNYQEQCDEDGVMVKVSRQALTEVLVYVQLVRPESASREDALEVQGTIEQLEKQLAFERKKSEPNFLHAGSPLWRIDLLCEQHELYTKDELVGLIQKVVQDDFCSRAQRIANDMG